MEYELFREELTRLGFDTEWYHMPWMREDYPQMIVGWVSNPEGIQLQVKRVGDSLFTQERIEYITAMESTLKQVEFTIRQEELKYG